MQPPALILSQASHRVVPFTRRKPDHWSSKAVRSPDTLPVNGRVVWDSKNRGGIADIDLDDGFLRLRLPDRFQQTEGKGATPGASTIRSAGSLSLLPSPCSNLTAATSVPRGVASTL